MDASRSSEPGAVILIILVAAQLAFADHYERGMELARAGSWNEAREEFLAGSIESPQDKRFLVELAGVEYRLGNRNGARHHLRKALNLDPDDTYTNDFLATLYFLDGNSDAALLFWNRIGKPRIQDIDISQLPKIRPELLDQALAFAPGDILTLNRYRYTMGLLTELDGFEGLVLDLRARDDGLYDATFRWRQSPAWIRAASILASLPVQIVEVKGQNLRGEGIAATALYRFEAQKRRVALSFASPLNGRSKARFSMFADARSETWNLGQPADFRVQKIAAGAALRFISSGRFSWETGATVADRWFPGAPQFASGLSVTHSASFRYRLLDVPEHRLTADLRGAWETGRLFGRMSSGLFSRTDWSLRGQWFPKPSGTDYQILARISGGAVMGNAPFDELFMLTADRDYDLSLRGHRGTIGRKRGSAPIGSRYMLANLDFYKAIWHPPLVRIDVGPVLDVGRVWNQVTPAERAKVLVDAGAQLRLALPGGFQFVLSYARDLRGGLGAFNTFTR
jgi:tetratricopeptide (TPR) repeat protein